MNKQANPYPLRIDPEVMEQVRQIAKEEGRSANKQIEFILRQYMKAHLDDNK